MLENPTVYVNADDNIDNLPNNVNIVYVKQGAELDEDGNIVFSSSQSSEPGENETESLDYNPDSQDDGALLPPSIVASSIVSVPRELADGSIVADVVFDVDDVEGASHYEVRYTQ